MLASLYAWLYNKTKKELRLKTAETIFNSPYLLLEKWDFVENTSYGIWFLEYPYVLGFLVLNDHIITLKGLWLYCRFTGDERALKLFNLGIISTKKALLDWDTGDGLSTQQRVLGLMRTTTDFVLTLWCSSMSKQAMRSFFNTPRSGIYIWGKKALMKRI